MPGADPQEGRARQCRRHRDLRTALPGAQPADHNGHNREDTPQGSFARILDPVFEIMTDRARRVVVLAQEEARALDHHYVGTEHILLGLLVEGESSAAKALETLGITFEAARAQVEEVIGHGEDHHAPSGGMPFTPRAKKVLELTRRESRQLGHSYIGPEHLLLGLVREGEGVATQVLIRLGTDPRSVRDQVIMLVTGQPELGDTPRAARPHNRPLDPVLERLDRIQNSLEQISATLEQVLRRMEGR